MRFLVILLNVGVTLANLVPVQPEPSLVSFFPEIVALLHGPDSIVFAHGCSGAILNNRAVLTAARCIHNDTPQRWRIRVGATYWATFGVLHTVSQILTNGYEPQSMTNDIAIVRTTQTIVFTVNALPGSFAGANYVLGDSEPLQIIGWGSTSYPGWNPAEYLQVHRIEQTIINIETCRVPYNQQGFSLHNSVFCSNNPNFGVTTPEFKCFGDPGSPVYHGSVIVGIRSFAISCSSDTTPAVNTKVSSFIEWIIANA